MKRNRICDSCAMVIATRFDAGHDGHRREGFCLERGRWIALGRPSAAGCWKARARRLRMPWPEPTSAEVAALASLSAACASRCGIGTAEVAERLLRVLGWTYGRAKAKEARR